MIMMMPMIMMTPMMMAAMMIKNPSVEREVLKEVNLSAARERGKSRVRKGPAYLICLSEGVIFFVL